MKLITLEKVLWALEEMTPEVKVAEGVRLKAIAAVDSMLKTRVKA
jgi:quinolinate synthase